MITANKINILALNSIKNSVDLGFPLFTVGVKAEITKMIEFIALTNH